MSFRFHILLKTLEYCWMKKKISHVPFAGHPTNSKGGKPPNSPDLSPCDFWLFDLIKQNRTDQSDSESLHRVVTKVMLSINKDDYKKTFDKWIERMKLCVYNHGNYFEHLMK